MATRLQKKLAKAIVEDAYSSRPKDKKDLLVSVGYSESTASANPAIILDAEGVKQELNELGFSEQGAKKVVAKILYSDKAKDHDRLDAADKVFKVHGSYAPDKHVNLNLEVEPSSKVRELTAQLNDLYRRGSKSGDGIESGTLDDKAQDKE